MCIPLFTPQYCYSFVDTDCSSTQQVILAWSSPQTSSVVLYYLYQDGVFLKSVASSITEHIIDGDSSDICTSDFEVTAVYQVTPLVESNTTICDITPPSPSPTTQPTLVPTDPTKDPTVQPTTPSPTKAPTAEPSMGLFFV